MPTDLTTLNLRVQEEFAPEARLLRSSIPLPPPRPKVLHEYQGRIQLTTAESVFATLIDKNHQSWDVELRPEQIQSARQLSPGDALSVWVVLGRREGETRLLARVIPPAELSPEEERKIREEIDARLGAEPGKEV